LTIRWGKWQSRKDKRFIIYQATGGAVMEETVKRINELARKAKESGLTDAELDERNELRKKYIESFRSSMRNQLDNIKFVEDDEKKKPDSH
jgi:uncharacterized protein YnzC (UPF0291/DUF896 family)